MDKNISRALVLSSVIIGGAFSIYFDKLDDFIFLLLILYITNWFDWW